MARMQRLLWDDKWIVRDLNDLRCARVMLNKRDVSMRVLFVTPFYEPAWAYGGVARANVAWARALAAAGISVSVWTTTANGDRELGLPRGLPLEYNGVQVIYYPRWRWSGNGFVSPDLLQACHTKLAEYDVVHAVGLWTLPSVAATFNSRREDVPYVISLHGMLMPWALRHHSFHKGLFFICIERPRLARANAVICTSELEKQHFADLGISNRGEVVPNVVDVANVVPVPARFRERYNLQKVTSQKSGVWGFASGRSPLANPHLPPNY